MYIKIRHHSIHKWTCRAATFPPSFFFLAIQPLTSLLNERMLFFFYFVYTERPQLVEPRKVEKIQEYYLETLRAYVENNRSPHKCKFAKLLAVLIELRSLGNTNSEVCFSLKVQNKRLPPFLAEIWDIQE